MGRCGPKFNARCNKRDASWAVYCNTETGWCGDTDAFRDAQPEDIFDFEPASLPGNL